VPSLFSAVGYTAERAEKLDNLDAAISSRLDAGDYIAPDNASIADIKGQTDKLTFDSSNNVYAAATVDVDEQAIADAVIAAIGDEQLVQVIVTPLSVRTQTSSAAGDTLRLWRYSKLRASFSLDSDLSGHDLRFIVYRGDTTEKLAECSTGDSEITIAAQSSGCLVAVEASDDKMPDPGKYRYVLRDETLDDVICYGDVFVCDAPDSGDSFSGA